MNVLRRKEFWLVALLPTLFGFDYGSKSWVTENMPVGGDIEVVPGWLSLFHAQNPFIMFSIPVPLWVIAVMGVVLMGVLAVTWIRLPRHAALQSAAIATIAAGGLGNLIDRIPDGSVTDFVRVYTEHPDIAPTLVRLFGTTSWPIFNVADVALIVGVGLWIASDVSSRRRSPSAEVLD